jgi:hypothetical protein
MLYKIEVIKSHKKRVRADVGSMAGLVKLSLEPKPAPGSTVTASCEPSSSAEYS